MDKIKELLKKYTEPKGLWRIFCMMAAIFLMGVSLSFLILVDMDRPIFLYEQGICSGFIYVIWNLAASHKHWIISGYVFVSEKSHWIGNPGKYDGNRLCGGFFRQYLE